MTPRHGEEYRRPLLDFGQIVNLIVLLAMALAFYFGSLRGIDSKLAAIDVKLENHSVRLDGFDRHIQEDKVLKSSDVRPDRRP